MDWFQYFEKLMCTFEEVDNNAHKNGIYEEIDMSYVIRPFIYTLEKNIYSTIKSLKNFNVSENAIKQILNTYTTKLFMFFNKVFIIEMNIAKKNFGLKGNTSEERFIYFIKNFFRTKEQLLKFYYTYPVLTRIVTIKTKFISDFIADAFKHLDINYKEIQTLYDNEKLELIEEASVSEGDSHEKSKSVIIFTFSNNIKLVYKPRNLRVIKAYNSFVDWINESSALLDVAKINGLYYENYSFEKFSKSALLCNAKESFQKSKSKNEFSHFTSFFYNNRWFIFLLIIITITIQIFNVAIPITIQKTIDKLLVNNMSININILCILGMISIVSYYFINVFRNLTINKFQIILDTNLMKLVFQHLLKLPYNFFINRSSGELIFRMNSNLYIRQILSDKIISLIIDSLLFFVYIGIMIMYSIELTILICIIGILIVSISIYSGKKNRELNEKEIIHTSKIQTNLNESINGIITIKSTGSEKIMFENWKAIFEKQLKCVRNRGVYTAFLNNVSTSIQVFIPVIVFIYGSYFIDKKQLTIGSLIAFNTVASSFIVPLISLSNSYSDILALKIYLNKLYDILNTEQEQSKKEQIKIKKGNIKIDNLYFRYSKLDNDILKGISLRIKAGEKVAIVGKSGSGKSTLIKLIIGLFKYDRGSIKIDNVDINHINIQNYRTQLGVVLQEPQIFNGTLKDNILLGKKYDHEKMNAAVKISNIENLINSMPMGLDTIIFEDGINLSGGQRQRISLARAIYNEPKIIIMDEPTSSLDNESEKEIIDNIFKLNNTCLIISHRFYNIEKFDKIILINKGKIEDIGSHNELIIRNNTYQKMYCIKNT